jgi:hypothetical protein
MTNHIIIGLGGRGGDVLKSFRRILFKNSLTKEKAESYPIQYLYVDSSSKDLKQGWDDQLGINYDINDWAKINIREGVDFQTIFENTSDFETIKPWFGNKTEWAKLPFKSEFGAGQMRKLGRTYFAANVFNNKDNSFVKNLKLAYDNVVAQSKSSSETTYHVIAGLSGGTGSGIIVDVIAQISKFIKSNGLSKDNIIVYGVLPERNAPEGKDTLGYYYPNAYAALKELNAIGLFETTDNNPLYYRPLDVQNFIKDADNRIDARFTSCFLFSNENENNKVIDYQFALPNMIGDFIYHTIIVLPSTPEGLNQYTYLTENRGVIVERDLFSGKKERSVLFGSAAIKRIEIPELEVIDLFGARLVRQFLNQQLYNNWVDGKGYVNENGQDQTTDFVENKSRKDNFLQSCEITLDQLCLKTPNGGVDIKNADDDWDAVSKRLYENTLKVYTGGEEKRPITYFNSYMQQYFGNQFRGMGMGVEKYYNEKTNDIERQADYFYKKIENHLLELWVDKNDRIIGINEAIKIIERLNKELQTISNRAQGRISHLTDPTKFDVQDADFTNAGCNKVITELITEFGTLIKIKSNKKIFEEASQFIIKLFKNKTDIIAYRFAIKLIDVLTKKLDNLKDIIQKITQDINEADTKLTVSITEKTKLFDALDEEKTHHGANVKMLYKSGSIDREFNIIISDRECLQSELKSFRKYIYGIGVDQTFEDLSKKLKIDLLTKDYLYYLNSKIPDIYKKLEKDGKINENNKLVGRNVINYFYHEMKSTEDLQRFFKNIKEETGAYSKFDKVTEESLDKQRNVIYAASKYVIKMPAYRSDTDKDLEKYETQFKEVLCSEFNIQPENVIIDINSEKKNGIFIFKAKANLAVRSFDMVAKMIHPIYHNSFINNPGGAELALHTEGSIDSYPKIIPFSESKREEEWEKLFDKEILAYFLLGYSVNYVEKNKDVYSINLEPETAIHSRIYPITDTKAKFYDIKDYLFIKDIQEKLSIEDRLSNLLINALTEFINKRENKKEDVRLNWIEKIKLEVLPSILKNDYEDDKTDKEFLKIVSCVDYIKNNILKN